MGRKIIFIDDEELVLQWEKNAFPWKDYQIETAGEALDGESGFQLIMEVEPDIVITDIRMPVMDGLEIIRKAKEENLKSKFIILSGYGDFAYAQKAIRYGVNNYLLKPIDYGAMTEAIEKVIEELEKEESQKRQFIQVKQLSAKNLFYRTVRESPVEKELLDSYTREFDRPENMLYEVAALITPTDTGIQLQNIVEKEVGEKNENYIVVKLSEREIMLVVQQRRDGALHILWNNKAESLLSNVLAKVKEQYDVNLKIVLSSWKEGLDGVCENWKKVQNIAAFLPEEMWGTLIHAEEYIVSELWNHNMETYKRILRESISAGEKEAVKECIDTLFADIYQGPVYSLNLIKEVAIELLISGGECLNARGIIRKTEEGEQDIVSLILNQESVSDIQNLVMEISCNMAVSVWNSLDYKNSGILRRAEQYIEEHISDELTVSKMADYLNLHPNYFSTIFKKEKEIGFVEYVTRLRIERAKELLKNQSLKIEEVGLLSGYNDVRYFGQVFRKKTGFSPSEYRQWLYTKQ